MIVSGGYFLTKDVRRPNSVAASLMPSRLLSMSSCICDFVPDVWAVEWADMEASERAVEALKFGLPATSVDSVVQWTTEHMHTESLGWPSVFFSVNGARAFAKEFLRDAEGLKLLGIGLHEECLEEFLSEEKTEPEQGTPGVYSAVDKRQPLEEGGSELGWEVLGYDFGDFHSWLCNSLENKVAKKCSIKPGERGFIESASDALSAAQFCRKKGSGAEPGYWAPWLVREYPLVAAAE